MRHMTMRKTGFFVIVFLALGALAVLPASQAQALNYWGVYSGMHGDGIGSVTMSDAGLHIDGMTAARELVAGNFPEPWPSDTYAYIKFVSGLDMEGHIEPWGNEFLTKAWVYLKGYIEEGTSTGPLTIEAYHISDDIWKGSELTWANQPLLRPGTVATLLTTQTISGVGNSHQELITWDLLAAGSPYLNIWKTQDLTDGAISILFKISGSNLGETCAPGTVCDLGEVHLWQGNFSLTLEGTRNPVPVPAAVWLLGSGLVGLIGIRRKIRK